MILPRGARPVVDILLAIAAVAFLHAISQEVVVSFAGVPEDAQSMWVLDWRGTAAPVSRNAPRLVRRGEPISVSGLPGAPAVVLFSRSDGTYVIDGPFTWPEADGRRTVGQEWRRTVQGTIGSAGAQPLLEWISATRRSEFWPRCVWRDATAWSCLGVPLEEAGVVYAEIDGHTWWSTVGSRTTSAPPGRISAWGRLVHVRTGGSDLPEDLAITIARPVPPPAHRLRGIRLETAVVSAIHTMPVAADAAWIAGGEVPAGAWLDVRARGLGPVYIAATQLREGAVTLPYDVTLSPSLAVSGLITGPTDAPAGGALLTLFRLIDPAVPAAALARGAPRARRVLVKEIVTAADGRFGFEDLADADYELIAWHGQFGRVSVPVHGGVEGLTVHLTPAESVRGRVLVRGRPAADVPVVSIPDPQAFTTADDLTELKGGDGRSGPDGRFVVALAPSGGGELRIGGSAGGVRRIPLPKGPQNTSIDLGDVELVAAIPVTFMLDQDPGCDLVAVGPIGHAGLQVVTATRTQTAMFEAGLPEEGTYRLVLACGRAERAVLPATVNVSALEKTTISLRVQ